MGWSIEGSKLRQKALDKKICAWCGKPFTNNRVKYWCSGFEGNDCYDKFYNKYFLSWGTIRLKALERDNYRCFCKQVAKEVHHIIPVEEGGEVFDLDNLMSLCISHHKYMRQNVNMMLVVPENFIRNKQITDYLQVN